MPRRAFSNGFSDPRPLWCSQPLKRLIRHRRTGEFLAQNATWTREPELALGFPDLSSAMVLREKLVLKDVDLVLMVGEKPNRDYDIILPLWDAPAAGALNEGRRNSPPPNELVRKRALEPLNPKIAPTTALAHGPHCFTAMDLQANRAFAT